MFALINGYNMHYQQFGRGKDVLFLHGWGADHSAFLFVAKAICNDFRVTLIDFAGFGKSDLPPCNYTVKDYAKDIVALLDYLNIDKAICIGHSFGGRVGIELSVHYKDRVRGLVLIDSAGLHPRRSVTKLFKIYIHRLLKKCGLNGLKGSKDYQALPQSMRATFNNVVNYHQDDLLYDIDCPTAIFWGDMDKETPIYMFDRFKNHIKHAQSFLLHGGHFSYADDYATFLLILKAYLTQFKQ